LKEPRTEGEFLHREARIARRALTETLGDFARSVGHLADPRLWVRTYPWKSLGAAALAGFFASGSLSGQNGEGSRKNQRPAPSPSPLMMLFMAGIDVLKGAGTTYLLQKIKSQGLKEKPPDPSVKH